MLGCFNPTLGQIWTNPNVGLKMQCKNLTQWLGFSIFDPKLGWNNPAFLECTGVDRVILADDRIACACRSFPFRPLIYGRRAFKSAPKSFIWKNVNYLFVFVVSFGAPARGCLPVVLRAGECGHSLLPSLRGLKLWCPSQYLKTAWHFICVGTGAQTGHRWVDFFQ